MTIDNLSQLAELIKICKKCKLSITRTAAVPGEGSDHASIMFIGEAPGRQEDLHGKPFVGRAGKVLDLLLHSIELERDKIYITNILKCRPPKNRNPLQSEIHTCTPYLDQQLMLINPQVIITLGNFATRYIMKKFGLHCEPIGKVHGKIFLLESEIYRRKMIPLYHPAAAVYNPHQKKILLQDFRSISRALDCE
jgi:DNA polymerase